MIEVSCRPKIRTIEIIVDGELFREMAIGLLRNEDLSGTYNSLEAWRSTFETWELHKLKAVAYDKISRKRYFTKELISALARLGFNRDKIEPILEEFQLQGYLNDEDGAESLARQGIRKKKGPAWINHKLRQKGGSDIAYDSEATYPKEVRLEIIRDLLIKNQKKGRKAIASIARKGFALDEIIEIYNQVNRNFIHNVLE